MNQQQLNEAKRFTKYMLGGGLQFWSGYAVFAACDVFFHVPFWPNKILAYAVGASFQFLIERYWAFHYKNMGARRLRTSAERFYGLMAVNFVLDLAIVGGLRAAGLTPYIGQFVSAGFFTFWNYSLFKLWVFKSGRRRKK
jgi:putative flippase GtrA